MSKQIQALKKPKKMPRTGGRGEYNKEEVRDKTVRFRTSLYKKIVKLGTAENDIDDIVSMLYDFWWEKHQSEK